MYDASPPHRVRTPAMRQRWECLTFLHWSYDPDVVARHLPPGLELDLHDDQAWVGLVPFRMHVQPPLGPRLNIVPPFPETNVRTYVRGPGGQSGIWFFSLDAGSATAVSTARATYALPYFRAEMTIDETPESVRYRSRRMSPDSAEVGHDTEVVPGDVVLVDERSDLENYLTARFTLWNVNRGRLLRTNAEHEPWPLRRATVSALTQNLLEGAGLPTPYAAPIAHFSKGVDVRISAPRPQPLHR